MFVFSSGFHSSCSTRKNRITCDARRFRTNAEDIFIAKYAIVDCDDNRCLTTPSVENRFREFLADKIVTKVVWSCVKRASGNRRRHRRSDNNGQSKYIVHGQLHHLYYFPMCRKKTFFFFFLSNTKCACVCV